MMKNKKKKNDTRNALDIDTDTTIGTPLAILGVVFFAVVAGLVVQMDVFSTGADIQNRAAVIAIPHIVATTTGEAVVQP